MPEKRMVKNTGMGVKLKNFLFVDIVITVSVVIGMLGGVLISIFPKVPPIIAGLFFGMGISSLVYRFLGGINQDSSVVIMGFKLAGTVGIWIACALIISTVLEGQRKNGYRIESKYLVVSVWEDFYPARYIEVAAGEEMKLVEPFEKDGDVIYNKFIIPFNMLQNEKSIIIHQAPETGTKKTIATFEFDNKIPKIKIYIEKE
ncbi:MAG: hypothetical protein KAS04_05590 [Candidatus Aenigmarchaeota archaeon]|nr:hypothetical protein [Candidatus Aenigmarchaeota archaeon]